MAYSGLGLLTALRVVDGVAWSTQNTGLLNWCCGAATVVGILIQFLMDRRRKRKARAAAEEADEDEERTPPRSRFRRKTTWWGWGLKQGQRRAG